MTCHLSRMVTSKEPQTFTQYYFSVLLTTGHKEKVGPIGEQIIVKVSIWYYITVTYKNDGIVYLIDSAVSLFHFLNNL